MSSKVFQNHMRMKPVRHVQPVGLRARDVYSGPCDCGAGILNAASDELKASQILHQRDKRFTELAQAARIPAVPSTVPPEHVRIKLKTTIPTFLATTGDRKNPSASFRSNSDSFYHYLLQASPKLCALQFRTCIEETSNLSEPNKQASASKEIR